MNVVAGRMHAEYAKLQREYCNLRDDRDRHKKYSTKLRGRLDTVEGKFQSIKADLANEKASVRKLEADQKKHEHEAKLLADTTKMDQSASEANLSDREVKRLGLCRRSILDPAWHKQWPIASRSLLNFDSLSEFLVYAGICFPTCNWISQCSEKRESIISFLVLDYGH